MMGVFEHCCHGQIENGGKEMYHVCKYQPQELYDVDRYCESCTDYEPMYHEKPCPVCGRPQNPKGWCPYCGIEVDDGC